jgi:hypothetical protein
MNSLSFGRAIGMGAWFYPTCTIYALTNDNFCYLISSPQFRQNLSPSLTCFWQLLHKNTFY